MKVFIYNDTGFLNDYFFKSLCLIYFPGESFPENDDGTISASFKIKGENGGFSAKVKITTPYAVSFAEFNSFSLKLTLPADKAGVVSMVAGKAFLAAGEKIFGFVPPWGHLTGLRPVKRAKYYLERGCDGEKVAGLFMNDYGVSKEKTLLSIATAKKEIEILSSVKDTDCAVYISVPFCPTRCDYCSFVSFSNQKLFKLIPDYITRLCGDIKLTGDIIKEAGLTPAALYIGGGTPSFLSIEELSRLFFAIGENIPTKNLREFSFEGGRPDTITKEKLTAVKKGGVNRISVNSQSTSKSVLDAIGRRHTPDDFFSSSQMAMEQGFSTVNTDIIAGLPGDGKETFHKTLTDVLGIGFQNITLHTLSIKNSSVIKSEGGLFDPVGKLAGECVSHAGDLLGEKGYFPYYLYRQKRTVGNGENTGFSLPGHECVYNVMMMEETSSVFACGAGAITKLVSPDKNRIERIAFPKYPFEYLKSGKGVGEEKIREFLLKG